MFFMYKLTNDFTTYLPSPGGSLIVIPPDSRIVRRLWVVHAEACVMVMLVHDDEDGRP